MSRRALPRVVTPFADQVGAYLSGYSGNLLDAAPVVEQFAAAQLRAYLSGVVDRADFDSGEAGR